MKTRDLNPTDILAWMHRSFVVNAERGSLVWKLPPRNHGRMFGREAGSFRATHFGKLYCHIKYNGTALKRGWLIFLWVNGRWPRSECIDHIDGNSTNDSASNLREATVAQNAWNHKRRARRIELPMGVRSTAAGRFQARIKHNKVTHHLGAFDTPEEAQSVYLAKRKELFGEYA